MALKLRECRTGSPFAMMAMVTIISLSFIYHVGVQFDMVLGRTPCRPLRSKATAAIKILEDEPPFLNHNTSKTSTLAGKRRSLLRQAILKLQMKAIDVNINETTYSNIKKTFHSIRLRNLTHPACQYFLKEGKLKHYSQTNVWKDAGTSPDRLDVTLVTQITLEKLGTLSELLYHWQGPVSCSIYVTSENSEHLSEFMGRFQNILTRQNVDIHLVLKAGNLYPINLLRNIALQYSYTQFVFLSDVDFMPSYGLHQYLTDIIPTRSHLNQEVLVVPALEFTSPAGIKFPKNKSELLYLWDRRIIASAESRSVASQDITNYTVWRKTDKPYQIKYAENYEPYIVANRHIIPSYNTSFLCGFRDKVSHLLHVHAMGLKFTVVPDQFTIHIPHRKEGRPQFFLCSYIIYQDLIEELTRKYPKLNETVKVNRALPVRIVHVASHKKKIQ